MHDTYGNTIFIKDYPYNKTVLYADCNNAVTYCVIYSNFLLENNKDRSPCFEDTPGELKNGYIIGELKKLKHYYENPKECVDFERI